MSELKVNSIKGTGASTAAITIDSSSGGCTANITNNLSNRNLIINGAMQIAQRGTSDSSTNGYGTVDRFQVIRSGVDENPTQSQEDVASGTTPYTLGFRKAFRVTNGNQTSVGTSDYISMRYQFEAQDIANSGWNYLSSSSFITLSFWVKSSVAQNFYGYFETQDGTQYAYPFETGSLTADTWTKITKTLPGNSNLTFDNDVNNGLRIYITQFWGTDKTGSITLNQWAAYNTNLRMPDFASTWYSTNDATFEITGVQFEVGSVATDFEHRKFAQELLLCRRYCEVWKSKNANRDYIMPAKVEDADDANNSYITSVQMRSTPTIEISSSSHISMEYRNGNMANPVNFSTRTYNNEYENRLFINMDLNSSVLSEGDMVFLAFANNTATGTGTFILDAEL